MKYLEVPDFHFAPEWADVSIKCAEAVAKAAEEHAVDFIAMPGDIYDHPIMTSDRGGINTLRKIIRKLTNICPVVAVYGTPSHEAPGSLEPLKDVGLVVLEPGKVYGLFVDTVREIKGAPIQEPELILFGIPELNKKNIQAQLGLTAEEANAEAVNLFRKYITEFVSPMRLKYNEIPAVMLMHGNVSDASRENETDIVLRASDIVIHTDDLRPANLDRVSLGHIHTPWESKVISAGYAGSWGKSWGEVGFKPAMNLVDILWDTHYDETGYVGDFEQFDTYITRIPYGTPERRKIIQPLSSYDPAIAYWLNSKDPNATLPDTVHPWSRVTFGETRQETRRVTQEQAATVKTLSDLFRLADPDVSKSILDKVDTIEDKIGVATHKKVDVSLQNIEVTGCILFSGKTAKLSLADLSNGVIGIRGNNGSGKSSILSFCTPYPLIVGKDTRSGRSSAIKDFFDSPDSKIVKQFHVNGQVHEHIITIKGAHTQSAKVECYLNIDGEPQLDKGTFDEMMTACEQLYGSFNDYLLTTFYVQPLQGKTQAGLMGATMTDIRDLVQSIAGIDRDAEKRHALDRVAELAAEVKRLEAWLTGAQEFEVDPEELKNKIADLEHNMGIIEKEIQDVITKGSTAREALEIAQEKKRKSDAEVEAKQKDDARIFEIAGAISSAEQAIKELSNINAAELEKKLADDDAAIANNRKVADITAKNREAFSSWERARDAHIANIRQRNITVKHAYEDDKRSYESKISQVNAVLNSSVEKCPNCGYVDPVVLEKIEQAKKELEEYTLHIAGLKEPEYESEEYTTPKPEPAPAPELLPELDEATRRKYQADLAEARKAETTIATYKEKIRALQDEESQLITKTYQIDADATVKVSEAQAIVDDLLNEHRELTSNKASLKANIEQTKANLAKALEVSGKIKQARDDVSKSSADRDDWDYIARMLQPSKIPAIELELVLDTIDAEASRVIEPFHESRYSFRTETQQQGKTGAVDRFDIRIHDNETGREKSFLENSPGQKAFFADAYTKALVRQRNSRMMRRYDPVIMDESDGPIQPELISSYYEVQRRFWTDNRVLVVSHSPTSHEYIEQVINMEDVLI
jgi:hypothetical protein